MRITRRDMELADVAGCMRMLAGDPVVAKRFSGSLRDLATVLRSVLGREAVRAIVFEAAAGRERSTVAFGIAVFVSDEFAQFAVTPPYPWIGAELVARTIAGRCPIITDTELASLNATSGVNLFVWLSWIRSEYRALPEVLNAMMAGFIEEHRGYNLRQLISQSDMGLAVETTLHAGGLIRDNDGQYVEKPGTTPNEFVETPHCFHVTRELALARPASWVSSLFVNERPRIFFTGAERRLLVAATSGRTDSELAGVLGISVSAIKKTWMSIYRRATEQMPSLLPDDVRRGNAPDGERGRTKKQILLAYLQQHPEELRPNGALTRS